MKDSTPKKHKKNSLEKLNYGIVTVSSSRFQKYGDVTHPSEAEDISGCFLISYLKKNNQTVMEYSLVEDSVLDIRNAILSFIDSGVDVVITTGGTGLSPKDVTIEAVVPIIEKEMPGFGELFRYRSLEKISTSVIMTRTMAGISNKSCIFCIPGSTDACTIGIEIIIEEAGHIIKHARKN